MKMLEISCFIKNINKQKKNNVTNKLLLLISGAISYLNPRICNCFFKSENLQYFV